MLPISILCGMLTAGLTGIKERGKPSRGNKTMVDALEPTCDAFAFALLHINHVANVSVMRSYKK